MLLPAALALILHGLLFTWKAEWRNKKPLYIGTPGPVTVIMTHKKSPEPEPSQPALTLKPEPEKDSVKKDSLKKAKKRKPTRKKETPLEPKKKLYPEPKTRPKSLPAKKENAILTPSHQTTPPPEPQLAQSSPPESLVEEERGHSKERIDSTAFTKGKDPGPISLPVTKAIPRYKTNPLPVYPRMARRRGYEGTVLMEVLVSREGRVQALRLLESSGHSVLDREAMAAVQGWVFEPGRRGAGRVEMWVKVPVRFKLR
ncbi:MAG: energy transducer TonB [Deltaproteobacteria bacterium]